jgi:diamine N-acetyltransferase
MFYGKRIRLRGVEREDVPRFVEWMNDPEVIEGLVMFWPMSSGEEQRWFERLADREPLQKPLSIDMREGEGWRHIGSCGYHNLEWNNRAVEIGISIGDKSVWNQGYGTETVALMVQHAFETLNLNRVFLQVHANNKRAIRAYEKCGFVQEGALRQAVYKHGQYQDMLVMSILRSEWEASKQEG